ncbi:exodeoxyribonuclease III [Candidatus Saccharibacteria bacterium]|nr:exodeoxyribonuclease III [Candidatus Saccharibacteria bacterium]
MNEARAQNATKNSLDPCKIRLFSWNVNGLRAVLRKGALQQFLQDQKPDVLCLQEIKCKPSQLDLFEADALKDYQVFWNPADRPGYSGTATLVRVSGETGPSRRQHGGYDRVLAAEPRNDGREDGGLRTDCLPQANARGRLESARQQALEAVANEGRILTLDLGNFYLVNVYTPNSKPDLSRLPLRHDSWDPAFKNLLKNLEKTKPVVACGDFNAAHEEIDLARPKTNHRNAGFTDEEREGITNLIAEGFLDTFRKTHPEERRYTWWSHWGKARENNVGWRIDYFFISNSLKNNLKSAEIYESIQGSDHCPISVELEF